jgi:hypothetical protein
MLAVLRGGEAKDLGDVRLTKGSMLLARFTDERGAPVVPHGASIHVAGGSNLRIAQAEPDGDHLRAGPLAPGRYVLSVREPGVAQDPIPFEVEDGHDTTVACVLRVGVSCSLRVDVEPGQPPSAVLTWSLRDAHGVEIAGARDFDHHKGLSLSFCLAPGSYTFTCSDRRGRSATGPMVVPALSGASGVHVAAFAFTLR